MNGENENSGSSGVVTFFLILLAVGFTAGIGFLGYKIFMGDIKIPRLSKKDDAMPTGLSSGIPAGPTDSQPSATATTDTAVNGTSWFPLKRVYGNDLHAVNPFVKDLQQFLNKFDSAKLDIDGAFGEDTEKAVDSSFGKKEVTMDDYNKDIAPRLGKPQVK